MTDITVEQKTVDFDATELNENLSSGSPSPSELKLLADEAERGYDPAQIVPTERDGLK